jgi:hypothetical protein
LLPAVAMAPSKWTIPEMLATPALDVLKGALVQPFWSVSGVNAAVCATAAPENPRGSMSAMANKAQAAVRRSLLITAP